MWLLNKGSVIGNRLMGGPLAAIRTNQVSVWFFCHLLTYSVWLLVPFTAEEVLLWFRCCAVSALSLWSLSSFAILWAAASLRAPPSPGRATSPTPRTSCLNCFTNRIMVETCRYKDRAYLCPLEGTYGVHWKQGCRRYLFLTAQTLTLHGVLIVDWKLAEQLPAALQGPGGPWDGPLALWQELHVLHGLEDQQVQLSSE